MSRDEEHTFQWPDLPEGVTVDAGPFIQDGGDGPGIYLPRHRWTWPKARHEAAIMAREITDENSVAVYAGKVDCRLDIEEGGPWVEGVPCYAFEAEERSR